MKEYPSLAYFPNTRQILLGAYFSVPGKKKFSQNMKPSVGNDTQSAFTFSKLTIETLEQGEK